MAGKGWGRAALTFALGKFEDVLFPVDDLQAPPGEPGPHVAFAHLRQRFSRLLPVAIRSCSPCSVVHAILRVKQCGAELQTLGRQGEGWRLRSVAD